MSWGTSVMSDALEFPPIVFVIFVIALPGAWFLFALWVAGPTTDWLMTKIFGTLLKPFEKTLEKSWTKPWKTAAASSTGSPGR